MRPTLLNWYYFPKMECTYFCRTDKNEKCTYFYGTEGVIYFTLVVQLKTIIKWEIENLLQKFKISCSHFEIVLSSQLINSLYITFNFQTKKSFESEYILIINTLLPKSNKCFVLQFCGRAIAELTSTLIYFRNVNRQ